MYKLIIFALSLILLVTACQPSTPKIDPNLPQKPYEYWEIGGRHPRYFYASAEDVTVLTQSNQWRGATMTTSNSKSVTLGTWKSDKAGGGWKIYYDLPQEILICWVSYVDHTFYRTRIKVPLWVRQEMVKPHEYYSEARHKYHIGYNNVVILAFAPGGNVTGWIRGVPLEKAISFGTGVTQRVPHGSDICPNPYIEGKIPDITEEGKAWLKAHGMPKEWREENNNITLAPDVRLKRSAQLSMH